MSTFVMHFWKAAYKTTIANVPEKLRHIHVDCTVYWIEGIVAKHKVPATGKG